MKPRMLSRWPRDPPDLSVLSQYIGMNFAEFCPRSTSLSNGKRTCNLRRDCHALSTHRIQPLIDILLSTPVGMDRSTDWMCIPRVGSASLSRGSEIGKSAAFGVYSTGDSVGRNQYYWSKTTIRVTRIRTLTHWPDCRLYVHRVASIFAAT